ncbi:MAG: pyruvate kinase [Clostridia bacterium]
MKEVNYMRRTKIICTLGPATDGPGVLKSMMEAGMNVARCNFSHADHSEHLRRFNEVRALRDELSLPIGIMLDTKGPEIRIKTFKDDAFVDGKIDLVENQTFTLTTRDIVGDSTIVSVTYENMPNDVKPGTKILIDDGLIALEVQKIENSDIICTVLNSGKLSNRKSINIPEVKTSMKYVSEKDAADIIFGCEQKVDYIAASFVRTKQDVLDLRAILEAHDGNDIQIIAKIENMEGIDNIDSILEVADGVMVARGDLGVEVQFSLLPKLQKALIKKCISAGKRVITATQMLESMQFNPRPTRAEVSDVANAVYDGTSCIMLSGETANGKYPVEAVKTMSEIALCTESDIDYPSRRVARSEYKDLTTTNLTSINKNHVTGAIAHATCTTTEALNSKAIVAFTSSGLTARAVSAYRPNSPIIGATPSVRSYHQLSMAWGVAPILCSASNSSDEEVTLEAGKCALASGFCEVGDTITITTGMPFGQSVDTNAIRIYKIK